MHSQVRVPGRRLSLASFSGDPWVNFPFYLLLPLAAGIVFAVSSMCFKRAFTEGAGLARTFFVNNILLGLAFLPMLLIEAPPIGWERIHLPLATGAVFFAGNVINFMAMRRGDVSLVTPLLGTKVLFVALISALIFQAPLKPEHWWGAALTCIGVLVLGATDVKEGSWLCPTTALSILSGACFGLCDSLLQAWAKDFGIYRFLPIMFAFVSVQSIGLKFNFKAPLRSMPPAAWKWLLLGSVLTVSQAMLLCFAIAFYHDATGINVVYSLRGLWTITLVWFLGHWFGNVERTSASGKMIWRFLGAILMTIAVALSVRAAKE